MNSSNLKVLVNKVICCRQPHQSIQPDQKMVCGSILLNHVNIQKHFIQEINTFIQQGRIKLLKVDSKDIFIVI